MNVGRGIASKCVPFSQRSEVWRNNWISLVNFIEMGNVTPNENLCLFSVETSYRVGTLRMRASTMNRMSLVIAV